VELLELINDTGSINQATKQMEMSYKKAWKIINSLNTETRQPFVITQTGGSSGGGSVVTDDAKAVIAWYKDMRERFSALLEKETGNLNS
jgi:molybdate transport system regulatory protein